MPVQILIDENETINAIVVVPNMSVEIIANVTREGDTIRLEGLHVELLTGGPLSRRQITLLCGEMCRHYRVERLIVQGARRTTGKSAGTIPKPIHYRVPK
jgi:hypothetical protein